MNFGRLSRLCQKELRETLRDRRTIGTLVLMPLLVYPILSLVLQRYLAGLTSSEPVVYHVIARSEPEGHAIKAMLEATSPATSENDKHQVPKFEVGYDDRAYESWVRAGQAHVGVRLDLNEEEQATKVEIVRLANDMLGAEATRIMRERLQQLNVQRMSAQLRQLKQSGAIPYEVDERELVNPDQAPPLLATVVPLILVLMTITGAVYPAIDLTAGERERGTIEAVIASPVSRTALLFAKYTAVVSVALLTAVANLSAMWLTLWAGGFTKLVVGDRGLTVEMTLQVLGLLVLLAGFFAGILLALTSFARSFKEAQAYLIPVMLLSLAPGVLSLTPDVRSGGWLSVIPLINVVLLARDVLTDQVTMQTVGITVLTTVLYAIAGISVAAQIFGIEALTRGSERSLGTLFRRADRVSLYPKLSHIFLCLAVLLPSYIVASGFVRWISSTSPEAEGSEVDQVAVMRLRLMCSAAIAALLFGALPAVFLWVGRVRFTTGFRWQRFSLLTIPAVVLLGLSLWTGAHEFFLFAEKLGLGGLDSATMQRAQATLDAFRQQPIWLVLAAFAVAPAVFEELTFRGFVFSGLRARCSPWQTIFISASLFGLFHVINGSLLTPERLVPSTLLGLVLGWVAYRTGSVLPGILLHGLHNGLLLTVAQYAENLKRMGIGVAESEHLPASWLLGALVAIACGLVGLYLATRKRFVESPL